LLILASAPSPKFKKKETVPKKGVRAAGIPAQCDSPNQTKTKWVKGGVKKNSYWKRPRGGQHGKPLGRDAGLKHQNM